MKTKIVRIVVAALLGAAVFSCKEINRQTAPVQLVMTATQILNRIDLKPTALNCNQNIATVLIQDLLIQNTSPPANLPTNSTLDDVLLTEYRISDHRTDGATSIQTPLRRTGCAERGESDGDTDMKTTTLRIVLLALVAVLALTMIGCKGESSPTAPPTTSTVPPGGTVTPPTGAPINLTVSNA